jgi:hypothetical protein
MKLFIGTNYTYKGEHQIPQFYIVDIDELFDVRLLHVSNKGNRMVQWGFAWDKDTLYSAHRRKGVVECDNKANIKAEHEVERFKGSEANSTIDPIHIDVMFAAPHQKLKVGRKIYIADSGHNEVKVFDIDTKELVARKTFEGLIWVNTLNYIDGYLYIIAHNMGQPSALIKTDLDLNVIETIENIGYAAHNVWSMDGDLWTCDSSRGYLSSIDGTQEIDVGEFPRGVAMNEDYLIVGITQQRNSITTYPGRRSTPFENGISNGGLAVINRRTLEVEKFIDLQDLLGHNVVNVFEVRLMDERDLALHLDDDNTPFSLDLLHE